jgi:putative glutamine amidotransferase
MTPPAAPLPPALMPSDRLPVIAVPCCRRKIGSHDFHIAGTKYVAAVTDGAQALPWLVPALGEELPLQSLLDRVDGVLLTGSPSNVHPDRYHADPDSVDCGPYDPHRDATTLPLIAGALARGLPLLAICRGFQELNVALGGSLHPRVHTVAGMMDHRDRNDVPLDVMYGPAHPVRLTPGGVLAGLLAGTQAQGTAEGGGATGGGSGGDLGGGEITVMVNSLHGQGIDRLAAGLAVEATAPDGLIEAVRVANPAVTGAFAIGVQWHPEWRFIENPLSTALMRAFGAAARAYATTARHG